MKRIHSLWRDCEKSEKKNEVAGNYVYLMVQPRNAERVSAGVLGRVDTEQARERFTLEV